MRTPLKIICSAQHFGYGPMAELVAVERAIRQDVRGADATLLLQDNPNLGTLMEGVRGQFTLFPERRGLATLDALLGDTSLGDVDAVISSFDSAAVFYGWFINRPVFFYDGLFWFWNFEPYRHRVCVELESLHFIRKHRDVKAFVDTYHRLLETDYHLTVLLAYHLSTRACARNGFGVATRLMGHPEFAHKTEIVGAVIDPTEIGRGCDERTHVLVSLSGSLAPLLSFDQNLIFARGALMFALEAFDTIDVGLPWCFSCHPRLYDALGSEGYLHELPRGFTVSPSFDYRNNLDMIRRAYAFFVSPGFSSIQEAACFGTPVFFLPEQNGGQPAQFNMLRAAGYDASHNWTVTDNRCDGNAAIGEGDVEVLYRCIEILWSEETRQRRIASLESFNAVLQDRARRARLIESQRKAVYNVFGDFEGAKRVAECVLDSLAKQDE